MRGLEDDFRKGWEADFGGMGGGFFLRKGMRFSEVSWGFFKVLILNWLKNPQLTSVELDGGGCQKDGCCCSGSSVWEDG